MRRIYGIKGWLSILAFSVPFCWLHGTTLILGGRVQYKVEILLPGSNKTEIVHVQAPFEVKVNETNWLIRLWPPYHPLWDLGKELAVGWDGEVIRDMSRLNHNNAVTIYREIGHFTEYGIAALWCTYCSGVHFRRKKVYAMPPLLGGIEFQIPTKGYGRLKQTMLEPYRSIEVEEGIRFAVRIKRSKAPPPLDVPQRIEYLGYVYAPGTKELQPPEKLGSLPKIVEFWVDEWGQKGKIQYPKRSRMRTWLIRNGKMLTEVIVLATNMIVTTKGFSPFPDLKGIKTAFADKRFCQGSDPIVKKWAWHIFYITNRWLSMEEVKQLPTYKQFLQNVAKERARAQRAQLRRLFQGLIIAFIILPIGIWVFLQTKHLIAKKKEKCK
ncbi:hypothetical protein J7L33_02690 [Candidatus Bathyarchaeota archaeon]|nr:hypothetical protein [Candidatus Bathyarchaeota archaeon]